MSRTSSKKYKKHIMERLLELHRKIRNKLCKEIFVHIMAVIIFSGLVIISIVDVLKYKNHDLKKLLAALIGICHFGLCATAILQLKYLGVVEMNLLKCKIWIYLEVYNIAATTAFIVLATRHLLPAPFHEWTGTALLLIIYWLPLIMYKTSQVCQMLELVSILGYLQDNMITCSAISKHCCRKSENLTQLAGLYQEASTSSKLSSSCSTLPPSLNISQPVPTVSHSFPQNLIVNKPISASSPSIPYEWALIESIANALP